MKKLILVVDDEPACRRASLRHIRRWIPSSIEVKEAESGRDAFDVLASSEHEEIMLITDGNMPPGMEGDTLVLRARVILGVRLKIALLVSGAPRDFEAGARKIGYLLYEKPIETADLKRHVYAFLDLKLDEPFI